MIDVVFIIIQVSIHAPAWGATAFKPFTCTVPICFNPRPRMGSDALTYAPKTPGFLFQSTPPHGERRKRFLSLHRLYPSFNPRPRMGSDLVHGMGLISPLVSIHAPAWGATAANATT